MSFVFVGASGHYLSTTTTPVNAAPLSFSAWFNVNALAVATQNIICIGASGDDFVNRFALQILSSNVIVFNANGSGTATTNTIASANTWYHAAGAATGNNSRFSYLSGVAGTENTVTQTPIAVDSIRIGTRSTATTPKFDGMLAEIAIWDFALTAAEVTSLAAGYSPLFIKPDNLRFYAPLVRNLTDIIEARAITNTGPATVGNHPRVFMPWQPRQRRIAVTAPAFKAAWADGSNLPVLGAGTY